MYGSDTIVSKAKKAWTLWFMLLLALLLIAGCASGAADSSDADGTDVDGDYDPISDGDYDSDATGIVGIEVTPPADSGLLTQQFVDVKLDTFDGTLQLKPSVSYTGEVEDSQRQPAEATITLVPIDTGDMIPGYPLPRTSLLTSTPETRASKAQFSATLMPGLFSIYIFPKDSTLAPPIALQNELEITEDKYRVFRFEEGLSINGLLYDSEGKPLLNMQVMAVDPTVWKRSSIDVTDHRGMFEIKLSKLDGTYNVIVESSEYRPFAPTVTYESLIEISGGAITRLETDLEDNTLAIHMEPWKTETCLLSGILKGIADDDEIQEPVADAKLKFSAEMGGGLFESTVSSDEDGKFVAELLQTDSERSADSYNVTVVPPDDSNNTLLRAYDLRCDSSSTSQNFTLQRRITFSGEITDESGSPVIGVEVQAHKLPTTDDPSVLVKSSFTGTNGRYLMTVDPGVYDILFLPPANRELARTVLRGLETSTDATINQELHPGQKFDGKVLDPNGNPIPFALIEVYRLRSSSGTAELIGLGSSDESGNYSIILP